MRVSSRSPAHKEEQQRHRRPSYEHACDILFFGGSAFIESPTKTYRGKREITSNDAFVMSAFSKTIIATVPQTP
jgi:hypothetical protein